MNLELRISNPKPVRTLISSLLAVLAVGWLLGGCSPKRVVNNEILTSEDFERLEKEEQKKGKTQAPAPESAPQKIAPTRDFGQQAVTLAKKQMGKMYQWGGQGPDRFDCSGLVYYVYGNLGVPMPRVSAQQAKVGREINRKELRPGDLLYFNISGSNINHVGIYVGNAKFVHAPRKGMPVRTDSLNNGWWKQKYRGARRIKG